MQNLLTLLINYCGTQTYVIAGLTNGNHPSQYQKPNSETILNRVFEFDSINSSDLAIILKSNHVIHLNSDLLLLLKFPAAQFRVSFYI